MKKVFYLALCFVATIYISSCGSKKGSIEEEGNAVYNDEAYEVPDDDDDDDDDYAVNDEFEEESFNVDHGFIDMPDDDDDFEEFASTPSSRGNDLDALLDEYERQCDKVVKLSKNIDYNDPRFDEVFNKAMYRLEQIGNEITAKAGSLSFDQTQRLLQITEKLSDTMK